MSSALGAFPVLLVGLAGLALALAEPLWLHLRRVFLALGLAATCTALVAVALLWPGIDANGLGGGGLRPDGYALFVQAAVLLCATFALLLGWHASEAWAPGSTGLLLLSASGACLLALAVDLLAVVAGLTAAMLPLVALSAASPGTHGREAALKGLVATVLGAGLLSLGAALISSQTGTTLLAALPAEIERLGWIGGRPLLVSGLALSLAGLAVFVAAVPFHMVFPDAVEGAPTPAAMLLTGGLLVAGVAAVGRVVLVGFGAAVLSGPGYMAWTEVLHGVGVVTILAANALALVQRRLKRLLACLASGQVGLALVTLAAAGVLGSRNPEELDRALGGLLAFLAVHSLTWICLFVAVGSAVTEGGSDPRIGQLEGLARRRPWLAAAVGLSLLCMSGLPLTAGFFARLYLLETMVAAGWTASAIAVALSLGLVLVMALGLVGAMVLREPREGVAVRSSPAIGLVAGLASLIILGLGFLPGGLMELAVQAAAAVLGR